MFFPFIPPNDELKERLDALSGMPQFYAQPLKFWMCDMRQDKKVLRSLYSHGQGDEVQGLGTLRLSEARQLLTQMPDNGTFVKPSEGQLIEPTTHAGFKLHISLNDVADKVGAEKVALIAQFLVKKAQDPNNNLRFNFKIARPMQWAEGRFKDTEQFTLYFDNYSSIGELLKFSQDLENFLLGDVKVEPNSSDKRPKKDIVLFSQFLSGRLETIKLSQIYPKESWVEVDEIIKEFLQPYIDGSKSSEELKNVPMCVIDHAVSKAVIASNGHYDDIFKDELKKGLREGFANPRKFLESPAQLQFKQRLLNWKAKLADERQFVDRLKPIGNKERFDRLIGDLEQKVDNLIGDTSLTSLKEFEDNLQDLENDYRNVREHVINNFEPNSSVGNLQGAIQRVFPPLVNGGDNTTPINEAEVEIAKIIAQIVLQGPDSITDKAVLTKTLQRMRYMDRTRISYLVTQELLRPEHKDKTTDFLIEVLGEIKIEKRGEYDRLCGLIEQLYKRDNPSQSIPRGSGGELNLKELLAGINNIEEVIMGIYTAETQIAMSYVNQMMSRPEGSEAYKNAVTNRSPKHLAVQLALCALYTGGAQNRAIRPQNVTMAPVAEVKRRPEYLAQRRNQQIVPDANGMVKLYRGQSDKLPQTKFDEIKKLQAQLAILQQRINTDPFGQHYAERDEIAKIMQELDHYTPQLTSTSPDENVAKNFAKAYPNESKTPVIYEYQVSQEMLALAGISDVNVFRENEILSVIRSCCMLVPVSIEENIHIADGRKPATKVVLQAVPNPLLQRYQPHNPNKVHPIDYEAARRANIGLSAYRPAPTPGGGEQQPQPLITGGTTTMLPGLGGRINDARRVVEAVVAAAAGGTPQQSPPIGTQPVQRPVYHGYSGASSPQPTKLLNKDVTQAFEEFQRSIKNLIDLENNVFFGDETSYLQQEINEFAGNLYLIDDKPEDPFVYKSLVEGAIRSLEEAYDKDLGALCQKFGVTNYDELGQGRARDDARSVYEQLEKLISDLNTKLREAGQDELDIGKKKGTSPQG